jgi:hypothetical protein
MPSIFSVNEVKESGNRQMHRVGQRWNLQLLLLRPPNNLFLPFSCFFVPFTELVYTLLARYFYCVLRRADNVNLLFVA